MRHDCLISRRANRLEVALAAEAGTSVRPHDAPSSIVDGNMISAVQSAADGLEDAADLGLTVKADADTNRAASVLPENERDWLARAILQVPLRLLSGSNCQQEVM